MITVFSYKQKRVSKLIILLGMVFYPLLFNSTEEYLSPVYYIIFSLLFIADYMYYYTKRLIVTDNGMEIKVLGRITWNSCSWDSIEEASVMKGAHEPKQKSLTDPYNIKKWLEGIGAGTTIKFIVVGREALYLNLLDIKNSSELNKILIEKVRFVK